jgi:putative FmdB family regulatory protein
MPTYEYLCRKCGHTFEEFQSITGEPLTRCPKCGTNSLARAMGTGGAVIFKGSGFYITDYKNGKSAGGGPGKKSVGRKEPPTAEKKEVQGTGKGDAPTGTAGPHASPPPAGGGGKRD